MQQARVHVGVVLEPLVQLESVWQPVVVLLVVAAEVGAEVKPVAAAGFALVVVLVVEEQRAWSFVGESAYCPYGV